MNNFLKNYLPVTIVFLVVGVPLYYYMKDGEVSTSDWIFLIIMSIQTIVVSGVGTSYIVKQIKKKRQANQQGNKSPEQMHTD